MISAVGKVCLDYRFIDGQRAREKAEPIANKVNEIYKKIGGTEPICLRVSTDFSEIPNAISLPKKFLKKHPDVSPHCITIPLLFLIKTSEVPQRFRILGPDDSRLKSDAFLLDVAHWVQKTYHAKKSQTLTFLDKEALRSFLCYIKDPTFSEKTKDFVLSHEVGHIYHKHSYAKSALFSEKTLQSALFAISAVALIISFKTTISFKAVVLPIALLGAFTLWIIQKIPSFYFSHQMEKEADAFSLKAHPHSAQGGHYFFKTMKNYGKKAREFSLFHKIFYTSSGDAWPLLLTHPNHSSRKRFCKRII